MCGCYGRRIPTREEQETGVQRLMELLDERGVRRWTEAQVREIMDYDNRIDSPLPRWSLLLRPRKPRPGKLWPSAPVHGIRMRGA